MNESCRYEIALGRNIFMFNKESYLYFLKNVLASKNLYICTYMCVCACVRGVSKAPKLL